MKKKLLAAAIGAALVAGPVMMAQAEVKLYGHAHVSLDSLDRGVAADTGEWFVADNASRFGIRASEDLGGGLKGVAQYEFLIGASNTSGGAGTFGLDRATGGLTTNRDNYLGLQGGFGSLLLGQIDTATKDVGGIADLFYREQLGESRAIINVGGMDARVQSGIHYTSPAFAGGWTAKVQYGVEDSFASDAKALNAGIRGTMGALSLGFGYLSNDNAAAGSPSTDGMRLAAKFDVGGGFVVTALWQNVSDIGGVSGADRDAMGIGGSFKAGNNIFKAQFYTIDAADNAATANGADQMSIGWDHLFSKTTKGYITYAKTSNDTAGVFGVGGNGHGETAIPAAGQDASGFSIGMVVDF